MRSRSGDGPEEGAAERESHGCPMQVDVGGMPNSFPSQPAATGPQLTRLGKGSFADDDDNEKSTIPASCSDISHLVFINLLSSL